MGPTPATGQHQQLHAKRLCAGEELGGAASRFINMPDDGHVVKTARALGLAQRLSQEYLDRPWIRIRDDKTWLNTQYLLLDSTWEHPEFPWVRTAGWDEAWKDSGLPETILVEHHRAKALSQVS